jgi:hypothetical protein
MMVMEKDCGWVCVFASTDAHIINVFSRIKIKVIFSNHTLLCCNGASVLKVHWILAEVHGACCVVVVINEV